MASRKLQRYTRFYTWAATKNRGALDLQKYASQIGDAISDVLPNSYNAYISVGTDDFVIDTALPITNDQARQIGKRIAQTPAIGSLHKQYGNSKQVFIGTDISL